MVSITRALTLRTHEASQLMHLHEQMEAGDVLVYDRAGCSYAQVALMCERGLHMICRAHQRQIISFRKGRKHAGRSHKNGADKGRPRSRWIKQLGKHDQLVRWFKPAQKPAWMTRETFDALPDSLVLRELRVTASRPGFRSKSVTLVTLVTTLTDAEAYPKAELTDQYLGRWRIEENLRDLKQTTSGRWGMRVLKCKTVDGVLKELAVLVLVHNLVCLVMVRLVMVRAASRQRVTVDRISFVDALRWLRNARGRAGGDGVSGASDTRGVGGAARGEAQAEAISADDPPA